jgi:hypothetical protein
VGRLLVIRLGAVLLVIAGCTTSQPGQVQTGPTAAVHQLAGGCASTVLTDAEPPVWAQSGFSHAKGTPWPVPWALGTGGTAVAYVFANQLVAGSGSRVDGSQNKVLWQAKDHPSGEGVVVQGRPVGQSQPVVTIAGGPSITDVPTAGCWTFTLTWSSSGKPGSSTINLEALPVGTNPMVLPR